MACVPCALITSCDHSFIEEEIVRQIIGKDDLPVSAPTKDAVRSYPWTIDNKYYVATINLYVVPKTVLVTSEIAEAVQAFIVYFDSTSKCGLDCVSPWLPLTEEWSPEVLILVCNRVSENGVPRQKAQEWCIAHGFELVELDPEDVPDEDDDFPESTGIKRIIQALNANVWSNMGMKDDRNQGFGLLTSLVGVHHNTGRDENQGAECKSGEAKEDHLLDEQGGGAAKSDLQVDSVTDSMLDLDIQELASLTTGEGDFENFERLFSKLKEMKDKASTLPHQQRKLHAEKVAKAFWMAIGGDQEEIEGLTSDDEN